jgi:hypothetical protein
MPVTRECHAIFCCIECGHRDHADVRAEKHDSAMWEHNASARGEIASATPGSGNSSGEAHSAWKSAAFTAGRYVKTNVLRAATHWPSMLCNSRCAVRPPRLQTSYQWIGVAEEKRYFPKEPEKHVVWPILLTLLRSRRAVVSRRDRVAVLLPLVGRFRECGRGVTLAA